MRKVAVIMGGGLGARFWPRSTEKTPKQFIHILGDGTMIQNTVTRLNKTFDIEDIYIVTSESMVTILEDQLAELPQENIIVEPFGRNTAPCLGLAYTLLSRKYDDDTIMFAFPSDHVIYNLGEFFHSLEVASKAAYNLKGIVTIGINPTRPETQYGYVQINQNREGLFEHYKKGVRHTTTFAEKPDAGTAQRFIESGDFLWNSGIFILRFDTLWESFSKYLSKEAAHFNSLMKHIGKDSYKENLEYVYRQLNSISLDYAIMEKAGNVLVVESSFTWSDMGTWDELYRLSMKDARNNVIEGDVISINTSNCLISSKGRLIGIVGLDDVVVVDSDEALLICKRGKSEDVKEIIDFMRRKHINKFL